MSYVIPQPARVALPVVDSDALFPVRRIYCVGRNYAAHAREMGSDPTREPPFFFCKPTDAAVAVGPGQVLDLPYPSATSNLHHEIELVVAIGRGGADIPVEQAAAHVWGYGAGLDMTRRDLQFALRDKGRPWELGKAFDRSAPITPLLPAALAIGVDQTPVWLKVNGSLRQSGSVADMIWSVPEIIATLSTYFRLEPGDLIFTGTPEGVGALVSGDVIEAGVDGVGSLNVRVV